ncbi:hypothetical protein BC30040_0951 [Bacillus cereus]|nr:hypothetical protein BC30040_0951 [Bacillus cereus]
MVCLGLIVIYILFCLSVIKLIIIFLRRMIIIHTLLGIIGVIVLLAFVIHPGVLDKRVPLKNKLTVTLPLVVIAGFISLYI